jgi:glutathione S-transferase
MKLHWSPRSPYVRKVMIAANHIGVADQLTCVRTVVSTFKPAEELFTDNPLNKLPTLVLDDGSALFDSRVICEYLDTLHDGAKLYPSDGTERFKTLRYQALGDGMLDICLIRLAERLKPEEQRNAAIIASNERKASEAVKRLESEVDILAPRPFDIGHIAVGTALGYLDFRFQDDAWRDGHPRLTAWHETFNNRPSVLACPVSDDS